MNQKMPSAMKALTVLQPWAWAISPAKAKRVENRGWPPPRWLVGQPLAIHAGKKLPGAVEAAQVVKECVEFVQDRRGNVAAAKLLNTPMAYGAFTGWGIVRGVVTPEWLAKNPDQGVWFMGFDDNVGWILDDVKVLAEPVPCRGNQGLWDVPTNLLPKLLEAA